MKRIILVLLSLYLSVSLLAQSNFQEAINQGDEALKNKDYQLAINKYFAAEAFDPEMKDTVQAKVNEVFRTITNLKDEAEKAKIAATKANEKAQQIIDAFYFYEGKYALAYKYGYYGFINQDGINVIDYKYNEAQPFDETIGLAKVKKGEAEYLINTRGEEFLLGYEAYEPTKETQALDLRYRYLSYDFPDTIFKQTQLRVLLLSYNDMNELPKEIGNLTSLTTLNLSDNLIWELPPDIAKLTSLKNLNLSNNAMANLPPGIGRLTELEKLKLSNNQLTEMPPEIKNLTSLRVLDLSGNPDLNTDSIKTVFSNYPKEIVYASSSYPVNTDNEKLLINVSFDKLCRLDMEQASKITSLDLSGKSLSELPPELSNLTNLTKLNLNFNWFNKLPPDIWDHKNLIELQVSDNQLEELPPELFTLKNLKTLVVNYNNLTVLPAEIEKLSELELFELASNDLRELPPEIGKLDKLIYIDLFGNPSLNAETIKSAFSGYPREIVYSSEWSSTNRDQNKLLINVDFLQLLALDIEMANQNTMLDLSYQLLGEIPPGLGGLTKLKSLYLSSNELSELPPEIGNLKYLETLDLSENQLTIIPPEIANLTNLTSLNLGYNKLSSLPVEIGNLTNLTWLNLSSNELTELPPEIGKLTNLTTLNISGNTDIDLATICASFQNFPRNISISTDEYAYSIDPEALLIIISPQANIPPEIGMLANLTELDFSACQLTSLPPEVGELSKLTKLVLSNNRLNKLPEEVGKLTNLKILNLNDNILEALPAELWNIPSLVLLDIKNNSTLKPEVLERFFANANNNPDINYISEDYIYDYYEYSYLYESSLVVNIDFYNLLVLDPEAAGEITYLDLSYQNLTGMRPEIWELSNLSDLSLTGNQLTNIPPQISKLTQLQSIDLSYNQLENLPKELRELKNLNQLYIQGNPNLNSEKIAETFQNFPKKVVYTADDYLGYYYDYNADSLYVQVDLLDLLYLAPERAKAQTSLYLSDMNLAGVPAGIWEMTNLMELNLASNELAVIPPEIGNLKQLSTLYLSNNHLTSLPSQMGKLSNLVRLELQENNLKDLPKELAELNSLNLLNLKNNQQLTTNAIESVFEDYPKEVVYTSQSYPSNYDYNTLIINVDFTSLIELDFENARELTVVDLSDSRIKELPPQIYEMINLTELYATGNEISELSPKIGDLTQLTYLYLSDNQLTSLPEQIGKLLNLGELDLQGNNLEDLPQELAEIKDLYLLNLRNNPQLKPGIIEKIFSDYPKQVVYTSESFPYAEDYNKLFINVDFSTLLALDFDKAMGLNYLDLSESGLTDLPPEIWEMTNLSELNLSGNKITELPTEISRLKMLTYLNLSNNPLSENEKQKIKNLLPDCEIYFD